MSTVQSRKDQEQKGAEGRTEKNMLFDMSFYGKEFWNAWDGCLGCFAQRLDKDQ
jgi:hypothetical protein